MHSLDVSLRRNNNAKAMRSAREKTFKKESAIGSEQVKNRANVQDLDLYMEKLYDEDMESKTLGAERILNVSLQTLHMQALIQNEALMSLLSRALYEDYKKNHKFTIALTQIFHCFSTFSQFHDYLALYRVGAVTLKIVDFELKRHELRLEEERALYKAKKSSVEAKEAYDHERKRNRKRAKKQDQLFFVCFSLLFRLAEDLRTEQKMIRKKIILFIAKMLERQTSDLVIVALGFLRKLIIVEDNKRHIVECGVIVRVLTFLRCRNEKLIQAALKLLYNASFDYKILEIMVKSSVIPILVDLLKKPLFRAYALRILYHLSMDDRCKSMFTYTEAIPIVMQLVINFPQSAVPKELIALSINLSLNMRNAELMCQNRGLDALISRVLKTKDLLLLKMLHNVAKWTYIMQEDLATDKLYKYKGLWAPFAPLFIEWSLGSTENSEILTQIIGILANLTSQDLKSSWHALLLEYSLVPFLSKLLLPGFSQDDLILEIIFFIGTICLEKQCIPLLTTSKLFRTLQLFLQSKQHDHEIILQTLYVFYRLLRYPETMEPIVYTLNLTADVLSAFHLSNIEIQRMANCVMDLILDYEMQSKRSQCGELIRQRRFELHNAEYLQICH